MRPLPEPEPRCLHVLVTIVSEDGTTAIVDINQPEGQPEMGLIQEGEQKTFRLSVALGEEGLQARWIPGACCRL